MAVADRTLMLKLIADVNQPTKQMKSLGSTLKRSASAAKAWGKAFTGALVIGGVEKLVGSLDDALADFKDGEDAARTLGQTWRNLGRDASQLGGVIDRIGGRAIDLGFDDAEVLRAFNTFLTKTGSVKDSTQGVQAAMNLARARGISFARAVKIVSGSLGDLGPELRRNRQQAAKWARNHPLEVTMGRIQDSWAEFVGQFSKGNVNKAFAALGDIGAAVTDLLFGKAGKGGQRTGGLVDRFVDIGRKLVPAIITGLSGLGTQLSNMFTTAVAGVDFAKVLGDAVGGAVELILDNQNVIANLAVVAGFLAAGMFVADTFMAAAAAMFAAPKWVASKAVQAAISGLGLALSLALRVAMFATEQVIGLFTNGLRFLIAAIPIGPESLVGKAAFGLGTGIQGLILAGIAIGLPALIMAILKDALDNLILPGGTRLRFNPETGRMERYAQGGITSGGMALVGEEGPELVRLPRGSRVYDAGTTAGMLGGGGGWGSPIVVNIHTGVGDPVSIGREVDRVLRAYRVRAGIPA